VGLLVAIRHQLRSGGIVVPPMFASTLLFALGIVAVIVLGASGLVILLYTSCRLPGLGKVGWWRGRAKRGAGRWAICDDMVD
jgi:hypothetical protein